MSLTHSPNTVTSGLVFNYDMNSIRSFKGAPTTNLVSNAATMSGFSNYGSGPVSTFVTEFGTTGWRMNSAGSWNGTLTGITIPTTGTYTFSAWYRYWGGSDNNNGATCYVSGWGGGDSAATIDKSKIGQWQRISITLNVTTASCTLYLISYGGTNGADNSTWDVTMPQVEAGSFATPWVAGARSNTQAITDLIGNNTITATSLTYASDGTFSFVRANSNYINISANTNTRFQNPYQTWSGWVNIASTGPNGYSELWNNAGNTGMTIQWQLTGVTFFMYNSAYLGYTVTVSNALNTWMNITCVIDNSNARVMILYKNGALVGTSPQWSLYTPPSGSVHIGGNFATGNGGDFTQGTISNVQLYNKALTAAEVQQNFNALRSRYGI
jgi:hypothetical protein